METRLQRRHARTLARGWDPAAPPRSLALEGEGPLWRDLHNFRPHEGRLARREALTALSAGSLAPPVLFNDRQANVGNAQIPLVLISHNPELSDDVASLVCVTTRELFLYRAGAWFNLAPTYEVGRVNVASGASTVFAASGSPNWSSNGVIHGNLIELPKGSNNWFRIAAWTETTLTLFAPYTGATLTNAEYRLRRTLAFGGPSLNLPTFAEVFNNDLYLAGPSPNLSGVWVLKAENIWGFPPPSAASILACTYPIQTGVDLLPDTSSSPIATGMTLLDDGRVVVAMTDNTFKSRVYYSSHLNPAVWSARPGGWTDVTAVPGTLRALGRFGPNLTLHYDHGIAFGVPTGEDDPPLAFRRTGVAVGCTANRTLKTFEGSQVFLARDGNVYAFDGAAARPLGDPVRFHLRDRRRSRLRIAHASLDAYRRELHLYFPQKSDSLANEGVETTGEQNRETLRFTFSAELGAWSKSKFAVLLGAVSDAIDGEPLASPRAEGGRSKGVALAGVPSYDPNGPASGGVVTSMLAKLTEESLADLGFGFTGSSSIGGIQAISDDDDFGMPGVDKTISHVTVWFQSATTKTESFEVGISNDGGTTWATATTNVALRAGDETFAHFWFEPATAEKWRVRLRCPPGNENAMAASPTRMTVAYVVQSEVEALAR